jgi:hypothetical protein
VDCSSCTRSQLFQAVITIIPLASFSQADMVKNMALDVYLYRKDRRWQKASKVLDVTLETEEVWSSEFRDIFSSSVNINGSFPVGVSGLGSSSGSGSFPGIVDLSVNNEQVSFTEHVTDSTLTVISQSDEVAHAPLRQTLLTRTFWKFDRGAGAVPRYLYAEYLTGDQILDNPPETV